MTFHDILDPSRIIALLGVLGVIAVIFAETGLFFGFFLPGDSLLFTAGFLASQGYVSLPILLVGTFIAAVIGDSVGYTFGRRLGRPLFERPDSRFFKRKYLDQAQLFYEKHGAKAIIIARFIPIVRTFAPIVAGVALMKYRTFVTFNIIGGFIWTIGLSSAGYFFGQIIPNAEKYVSLIIILIVFVSFLPAIFHLLKMWMRRPRKM